MQLYAVDSVIPTYDVKFISPASLGNFKLSNFLMNINKIIQKFKRVMKKGIQLNNRKSVNTILYENDQIL